MNSQLLIQQNYLLSNITNTIANVPEQNDYLEFDFAMCHNCYRYCSCC